jgi:hypothetical protein
VLSQQPHILHGHALFLFRSLLENVQGTTIDIHIHSHYAQVCVRNLNGKAVQPFFMVVDDATMMYLENVSRTGNSISMVGTLARVSVANDTSA